MGQRETDREGHPRGGRGTFGSATTGQSTSDTDDQSIAIEVLAQLEILNHQLITREDIPALLDFLDTPPRQAARGWKQWRQYWDGIDFAQRRRELATNPYYIT
jgi:hypothetical protein